MTQVDDKYKHHNYLHAVAEEDARFVRGKDLSYGASWKKRGGVGVFMMMARKWDRLETMLEQKRVAYDLFQLISDQDGGGDDGMVLAEVRDLRRYLLLVECEMMARGVVPPPRDYSPEEQDTVSLLARACGCSRDEALRKILAVALHAPPPAAPTGGAADVDVDVEVEQDTQRRVPRYAHPAPAVPSPDADSARHASLVPWAVNMRWRFNHDMQPGGKREDEFNRWWHAQAPGLWVLEPVVGTDRAGVPSELSGVYRDDILWQTIKIEDCPPDARDWFPVLRRTLNTAECNALPAWQSKLYSWCTDRDAAGEWTLQHDAWAVGAPDDVVA